MDGVTAYISSQTRHGADSLCTTLASHSQDENPLLVSHRASKAAVGHRRDLVRELRTRFARQGFRIAEAVVSLTGSDASEDSQRSRSMLYASFWEPPSAPRSESMTFVLRTMGS